MLEGSCSGDERVVVATECTVVLAWLPLVQLAAHDHDRKRQTEAAERLGQGDDVGLDAHFFEAEEGAATATASLNVVRDQQHFMLAAEFFQFAHPVGGGSVQSAFTLNDFHNHCRWFVDAAARIAQQLVHHGDGVDLVAKVVGIGHTADVCQRHAGGAAVVAVTRGCQGAYGHAVEAVGETDDVAATGNLACQLERGFNRVGARRATELHNEIAHAARLEDHAVESFQEAFLGIGIHVQAVGHAVVLKVFDQRFLEHGVVVPVVEGAGAGKKVDVMLALAGDQLGATRLLEHNGEGTAVAANTGFMLFELFEVVHGVSWFFFN